MNHSRSSARAEGATYATVGLIPPLCMQLTLKPMTASATANATTSTTGDIHSGNECALSTISSDANISEQSETTSSTKSSST